MSLTSTARDYLVDAGYDINYGARPLKREVSKTIESLLAHELIKGTIPYNLPWVAKELAFNTPMAHIYNKNKQKPQKIAISFGSALNFILFLLTINHFNYSILS